MCCVERRCLTFPVVCIKCKCWEIDLSSFFVFFSCRLPYIVGAIRPQLNLQLPRFRRTGSRRSKAGSPSPSDFGGNYSIASSGDLPVSLTSTQRGGEPIPLDTFSAFNPNMLSVSAQQFPSGSRRASATSTAPSLRSMRDHDREPSASNSRHDAFASSRENTQSPVITHSVSGHSITGGGPSLTAPPPG